MGKKMVIAGMPATILHHCSHGRSRNFLLRPDVSLESFPREHGKSH